MNSGAHLSVAITCAFAGLVDVVALTAVVPRLAEPSAASATCAGGEPCSSLAGVAAHSTSGERASPVAPTSRAEPSPQAELPARAELPSSEAEPSPQAELPSRAEPSRGEPPSRAELPSRSSVEAPKGSAQPLATVWFDSEGIELPPEGTAALRAVVAARGGAALRVVGHADPSGRPEGHAYFSRMRARAVGRALVALGVPAAAVLIEARGADEPLEQGRTAADRARNRRVEVWRSLP